MKKYNMNYMNNMMVTEGLEQITENLFLERVK
jgi:hypothetical protein